MNIIFTKQKQLNPNIYEPIGPHLYAPQEEWAQATAWERHRALIGFYASSPANPNAVFCGISGAVMRGIPILGAIPLEPRCYSDTRRGATQDLIKWRRAGKLPPFDLIDGVRVACVERILIDLCVELNPAACLVALNHCIFTRLTSVKKLSY